MIRRPQAANATIPREDVRLDAAFLSGLLADRDLVVRDEGLVEFRMRLFPPETFPDSRDARSFAEAEAANWRRALAMGGDEWAAEGRGRTVRVDWRSCELVARDFPDRIAGLRQWTNSAGTIPARTIASKIVFVHSAEVAEVVAKIQGRYAGLNVHVMPVENLEAIYIGARDRTVLDEVSGFVERLDDAAVVE